MNEFRSEEQKSLVIIDPEYRFSREIEGELMRRNSEGTYVHLITDPVYIDTFFHTPRNIDVLVVDREHYGEYLSEHTIRTIYVTVPEIEVESSYPENVHLLMNYLPSKEILAEIDQALRPDEEETQAQAPEIRETKIIAVSSPVGGSGKSLVAFALARKLRKLDQTVLLVGCDDLQSISVYLSREIYAEKGLAEALREPDDQTHWTILQSIERDEVDYLRPFEQDLPSTGVGMREWATLIRVLKEKQDFDYLVLDIGSLTAPDIKEVFDLTDVMVLVTEENEIASRKLQRLMKNPDRLPKCECVFIANEFRSDGLRLAPETIFGTIAPYTTWVEALEDPVFYRIALKVTE